MQLHRLIDHGAQPLSSIYSAWFERAEHLCRYLPERCSRVDELARQVDSVRQVHGHSTQRNNVVDAIRTSLEASGQPLMPAQSRALETLARPDAVAVVTGQQPCLFGGPIFVVHKVATALRLTDELRAQGVEHVVTVFWNHDEDHDWGEANHVAFVNPALDIQSVRLRLPSSGLALGAFEVPGALERAVHEARDLIVQTPWGLAELEAFLPKSPRETVATTTTRMLSRHFGAEGLLVLEATRLPPATREVLRAWHGGAGELRQRTSTTARELEAHGHVATVDAAAPLLFSIDATGRRRAVEDGRACPLDHAPSAAVLLRPVWQDWLLPTLSYVAGPGEIAYNALLGPIYEACSVRRPQLVPRASLVLVDPRALDLLDRFDLSVAELRQGAEAIEARIVASHGTPDEGGAAKGIAARVRAEARELKSRLAALEDDVAKIDHYLVHPLHRIATKTAAELGRYADKVERQRRNRTGLFRQHARRLCAELAPRGACQERVLPLLPFVARGGPAFARRLIDVASPFDSGGHGLDDGRPRQRLVLWQPEGEFDES